MEARGRDHACLTQVSLWVGGGRAGLLEGTKQTAWASIHAQQEETVTMYTVTVTRSTDLVGDTTEVWEVEPSGGHPASVECMTLLRSSRPAYTPSESKEMAKRFFPPPYEPEGFVVLIGSFAGLGRTPTDGLYTYGWNHRPQWVEDDPHWLGYQVLFDPHRGVWEEFFGEPRHVDAAPQARGRASATGP